MLATSLKFKLVNGIYEETDENYFLGYTFTNSGQNYRVIYTSFSANFEKREWTFTFSLFVQNNITLSWSFVENKYSIACATTYRDAESNFYYDSGDNENIDNAFIYSFEVIEEEGVVISNTRIKTLKDGLSSEWDIFYNGVFMGICKPEIDQSIIRRSLFGITEII